MEKTRTNSNLMTSEAQLERLCAREKWVNPYEVLLLGPDSTEEEIRSKFRKISVLVHPDKARDDRALQAFHSNSLFSPRIRLQSLTRPRKEKNISKNNEGSKRKSRMGTEKREPEKRVLRLGQTP